MYDFKPPYYGAAYYPEAWPREEIDADLDRLQSHGLNTVRVAEFAWSTMEPEEGKYDLSLFREVVDKCKERGISVIMCTPSATPPSWMAHKYPEIFVKADNLKALHGHRRMTCPTNKTYRKFCRDIVEVMAKEFANDENIIGWQLDNEISILPHTVGCNCPDCVRDYRNYLRRRYGTIDALNKAWEHYTWSSDFSSFDEVDPYVGHGGMPPVQKYHWECYKSYAYEEFLNEQTEVLKKYTDKPIGTDMMPFHQYDPAHANSRLDLAQFNYYGDVARMPFWLDSYGRLFDRPIWLTETSCNWNASNNPNGPRKKGWCTANTLMSFASGGEMCLYWLFRSHKGGHEMAHGSVIDAWGRDMPSSNEVRAISKTLNNLRPMIQGTRPRQGEIAISFFHQPYVMDRYISFETMGHRLDYISDIRDRIYMPLLREKYRPDVLFSANADLTPYKLIISHRQLTLDEGDFLEKIMPWVENGGTWVVGPYSDMFTADLAKYRNAPFGHLEDWAKIERTYYVPSPNGNMPGASNIELPKVIMADGTEVKPVANLCFDAITPKDGAKALATYSDPSEYLEGFTAITETKVGKGRIILMGVQLDTADYRKFIKQIAAECGIEPITSGSDCIEVNVHEGEYGTVFSAIECSGSPNSIVIPFDCTDIDTGEKFTAGQSVAMEGYKCIFAKKDE
ncbi:MAG: beta-galactosidase [Clostridia bacterium]|nr:beta-galactosidase [Clostridia bacterium]